MEVTYLSYDDFPLLEKNSKHLFIGHREMYSVFSNYLFVKESHKPEKTFLAAALALNSYLDQNPKVETLKVYGRPEILYYVLYNQTNLNLNHIELIESQDEPMFSVHLLTIMLIKEAREFVRKKIRERTKTLNKPKDFSLSICLTTFNRSTELEQTLLALESQTDQDYELIVLNDGSHKPEVLEFHQMLKKKYFLNHPSWKWIDQDNTFLGQARNNAAQNASRSCLLFIDDDNVPKPNMVEMYRKYWTLNTQEVFVSSFDIFYEGKPGLINSWHPFTDPGFSQCLTNVISDAQCLISKALFLKLGKYTTERNLGFEDWEFFLKVLNAGYEIFPIPEILYSYRVHETEGSMRNYTKAFFNNQRAIRPLANKMPRLSRSLMLNIALFNTHNYIIEKKLEK